MLRVIMLVCGHRVPELRAPVSFGNMYYGHLMLVYGHRVPELRAPVSFGNMCYGHLMLVYGHRVPELRAPFPLEICVTGTAPRLGLI